MSLSVEEIRRILYTKHTELKDSDPKIALKQIHVNKCPIVVPAGMLNSEEAARLEIDGDTCRTHLQMIRSFTGLSAKIADIYSESPFETDSDPDMMLYSGGFFSATDKKLIEQVRASNPVELSELDLPFQDVRLEEMLFRYKARNCPSTLTSEEQMQWEEYRRAKLINGDGGHLKIERFYERLNELYSQPDLGEEKRHILEELAVYAEAVYPMEESFDDAF
jgi:exodeoxyribonuclease-1